PPSRITLGADAPHRFDLAPLSFRVDALDRRRDGLLVPEAVHPDDDLFAAIDRKLGPVGRLLDSALLEACLERGQGPAHRVDLVEVARRGGLELISQG